MGRHAGAVSPARLAGLASAHQFLGVFLILTAAIVFVRRHALTRFTLELPAAGRSFFNGVANRLRRAAYGEDRWHLYALAAMSAVAIIVRLAFLFEPIRHDEANAFTNFASKSFWVLSTNYSVPNNHVLHTALVRISFLLFGNTPWALRLPALVSGLLLIPASYLMVRRLYGREAGLLTVGFVVSSPVLINYSVNARGYTLLVLLFSLTLFLATYLKGTTNAFAWMLFACLASLGFYTIPIFLYAFGMVWLWLFLSILAGTVGSERARLLKRCVGAGALTGLLTLTLYLPIILRQGWERMIANEYVVPQAWSAIIRSVPDAGAAVWTQWNAGLSPAVAIGFALMALLAMVLHWRLSTDRIPIWAAILWIVPMLVLQRVVPPQRTWLFLLPVYFGLVSASLVFLVRPLLVKRQHGHVLVGFVAIVLALGLGLNDWTTGSVRNAVEGAFPQAEEIVLFLKSCAKPGDKIVAAFPSAGPIRYYWNWHGFPAGYFANMRASADRLLVVTVKSRKQTPEYVLDSWEMSLSDYGGQREVKEFESADVYEMDKVR